jgi:sporulation protein YlmC with PRC-barrel domain
MFRLVLNKKTIWSAVSALTLLFAVCPVRAYETIGTFPVFSSSQERTMGQHEQMSKMAGRIDYLQNVKGLLRADIKNDMGENLGSVRELILDDTRDVLSYVVIESNGTFHPVPWSAFSVTPNNIELNIDKIKFVGSPQTGSAYIEKLSSPDFRNDVENFYSDLTASGKKVAAIEENDAWMKEAMASETPVLRACTDVIGLKVDNIQGENIASVRTLLVDTHQGKIAYALVGFGGLFGLAEKTAAVPWTSLAIQPFERVAYLDADRAALEMAAVDERNPVELTQPSFARTVEETFGEKPYWQALGFVAPDSRKISMDAWRADSAYNAYFNPESITTISGVIRSVGIFTPEWGNAPGLKLAVEIGEGESVVIHCGPENYALQEKIDFKPDTYVTITGSKVTIGDESVIMASEIKVGNKTLLLRDSLGAPKWNVDEMKHAMESTEYNAAENEESHLMDW